MKQIIITVSKLNVAISEAAKRLMSNYTEAGAIELLTTIHHQRRDDYDTAFKMYGERLLSRINNELFGEPSKERFVVADMQEMDGGMSHD